ncbi:MAG: coproporphyrinogen III oxidase [Gammaproteobacteria bacterium]|nr:coproporphyrinogen III oxidase [Gammaproteobacteria bacterium]
MSQQDETWDVLIHELDPSVEEHEPESPVTSETIARPRVCTEGDLIEKAACNFTHSRGASLPSAASARNPHLAGKPFSASALSVIVHPRLPRVPTTHMNVRFFHVDDGEGHWHFGGGMDLTPHFLYGEDAVTWHEHARTACRDHAQYRQFKQQCDDYFFLPHRNEARGIGGLFFDDLNEPDFASCFRVALQVCEHFRSAYTTIFDRRKETQANADDEYWMLHRRSRYAEFNLIHDRGTKYGLQSGRRVESVLASMPPRANWVYGQGAETEEQQKLLSCLQNPREWL